MREKIDNTLPRTNGRSRESDLGSRAYQAIREAILSMSFQPGQQLQESSLAQWLGISRTPVREALRRLQSEGLIETSSLSRGVTVAQVSAEDIENAYLIIEVAEGLASRLAAERLTEAGAQSLWGLVGQMEDAASAADTERWIRLDAELHDTVRTIAASPKLSQLAGLVYPTIERVRNLYLREGSEPDRLAVATAGHRGMVEAILHREPQRAEELTRELFARARADNVRLLRHWVVPLRRSF